MNDVLIVIPSYNYGKYLKEAIDSALAQSVPCKIAVVDDGSSDDTQDVALGYGDKIQFFHKEHQGVAAISRNYGIKKVESEFILPLDGDDKLKPFYVENCLKIFQEQPECSVVTAPGIKFGDIEGEIIPTEGLTENIRNVNCVVYCSMFRRSFYEAVDGYDETIPVSGFEDWAMWAKGYQLGFKSQVIFEPQWYYRIHRDSMTFTNIMPHTVQLQAWMKNKGLIA